MNLFCGPPRAASARQELPALDIWLVLNLLRLSLGIRSHRVRRATDYRTLALPVFVRTCPTARRLTDDTSVHHRFLRRLPVSGGDLALLAPTPAFPFSGAPRWAFRPLSILPCSSPRFSPASSRGPLSGARGWPSSPPIERTAYKGSGREEQWKNLPDFSTHFTGPFATQRLRGACTPLYLERGPPNEDRTRTEPPGARVGSDGSTMRLPNSDRTARREVEKVGRCRSPGSRTQTDLRLLGNGPR